MRNSLWIAFAWEAGLVCVLLALALMDRDHSATGEGRFPLALVGTTFLLAVALPFVVPGMLLHVQGGAAALAEPPGWRKAMEHSGFGALAGCGCGCLMFAASRGGSGALRQAALPALVGPYVGPWVLIELVAAALFLSSAPLLVVPRRSTSVNRWGGWPLVFWLATLAGIVTSHIWPVVFARLSKPSLPCKLAIGVGLLLAVLTSAALTRLSSRRTA
jgi:hypothetical protein